MASPWVVPDVEDGLDDGLFVLFKRAVRDERQAHLVYALALTLCADPARRPLLQGLIDEAKRWHAQILNDRFNAMVARDLTDRAPDAP